MKTLYNHVTLPTPQKSYLTLNFLAYYSLSLSLKQVVIYLVSEFLSQDGFSIISSIILLEENVHCAVFTSKFLEWAFCAHLLFLSWVYSSRLASYRCRNMTANGEEQEARILAVKPTL